MQYKIELVHMQRGQQSEATRGKANEDDCNREQGLSLFYYVFLANSAESSLLQWQGFRVLEWRM